MKSRIHPKYKTRYRVGNWRAYERALVQRGDVTLWLSADARDAWRPSPSGQPGGQKRFSDLAIETALTLRLVFRLPLRHAEGFLRSVLSLMDVDLEAPDHTTLSRRSRHLDVALPVVRLTEVVRQAAQRRSRTSAHRINQGSMPDLSRPEGDRDFYFVSADDPETAVPRIIELVKTRIPQRFPCSAAKRCQATHSASSWETPWPFPSM